MMSRRIQSKRPRRRFWGLFIILLALSVNPSSSARAAACHDVVPADGPDSRHAINPADGPADCTADSTGPKTGGSLLTRPLIAAIFLYQKVISPQQGEVCVFQPTCSHFAQQALRTYGLVQGGLMTSDRLQRCHSCAGGAYLRTATGAVHDPIDDHVLWGPARRDRQIPHRSPLLAAGLSSAIPGVGKVYAGRPADGFYSLLVTGSSALVAISYGRDEHWTRAGLFGAVGLFFYLGNIYGSAVEAERFNQAQQDRLLREAAGGFHDRSGLLSGSGRSAGYLSPDDLPPNDLIPADRPWPPAEGGISTGHLLPDDVSNTVRELETAARRGYGLPRRSPNLAVTMSLILPGSGQAYAGRPWNGLVSLIFNAAAGYLTVDAFRDDRRLDGTLLLTLVWSRFYLGGVDNAARYAEEFNRKRIREHLEQYRPLMQPDYSR